MRPRAQRLGVGPGERLVESPAPDVEPGNKANASVIAKCDTVSRRSTLVAGNKLLPVQPTRIFGSVPRGPTGEHLEPSSALFVTRQRFLFSLLFPRLSVSIWLASTPPAKQDDRVTVSYRGGQPVRPSFSCPPVHPPPRHRRGDPSWQLRSAATGAPSGGIHTIVQPSVQVQQRQWCQFATLLDCRSSDMVRTKLIHQRKGMTQNIRWQCQKTVISKVVAL